MGLTPASRASLWWAALNQVAKSASSGKGQPSSAQSVSWIPSGEDQPPSPASQQAEVRMDATRASSFMASSRLSYQLGRMASCANLKQGKIISLAPPTVKWSGGEILNKTREQRGQVCMHHRDQQSVGGNVNIKTDVLLEPKKRMLFGVSRYLDWR